MNPAPFEKERLLREKILDYLKKNPTGKTTTELEKYLKISRKTVEKHLQLLTFENEAYIKQFGPTRAYYPNNRIHYIDFKRINLNNKIFWLDLMENEYGRYLLIQEKRKEKEDYVTKGSILIPLDKARFFTKELNNLLKNNRLNKLMK